MRLVSKAPYNFITLENRVMKRYKEEKEFVTHDKYHNNYKSGTIEYELEVKTPLHISNGKDNCFLQIPVAKMLYQETLLEE